MLGALLIQPQILLRMRLRTPLEDLIDEAMALLHRLVVHPGLAGELAPAFVAASAATAERVRGRAAGGWPAWQGLVRSALAPWIDGLVRHFGGTAPAGAPELLLRVADALEDLDGLPALLSDDAIRAALRRVGQVLERDLGLSQQMLRDEGARALADLAAGLRGLQDLSPPARATAHALACLVDRLRVQLLPQMPALDFGVDRVVDLLLGRLRAAGFEALRTRAACLLGRLRDVLRAAAGVATAAAAVAPAAPRGRLRRAPRPHALARASQAARDGAAPAQDPRYCWYASWLFRRRLQNAWLDLVPRYPGDEVWQQSDGSLLLRRVHGQDQALAPAASTLAWHEQAPFGAVSQPLGTQYSFGLIPPAFLEVFTRVAAAATDTGKSIWHIARAAGSPQELGQLSLMLWNWVRAMLSGAAGVPLASAIVMATRGTPGSTFCISPLITWLLVLGFALEGMHTNVGDGGSWVGYYATLLGADTLNAWLPERALRGVHDLLISLFTLINQTGPALPGGPVPSNFEHGQPLVELGEFLALLLLVLVIPRELYAHPGYETTYFIFLYWFLLAPLMAAAGAALGALTAAVFSGRIDGPGLARQAGFAALRSLFMFNLYLYLFREGDHDGGRYTTPYRKDGTAYPGSPHVPFVGYAPKATSPYKLPYPAGKSVFVPQAHFGIVSHMPMHKGDRPQIYAVDFAHDFRADVLAVRDGTVVDWFDWVTDNSSPEGAEQGTVAQEAWAFMSQEPGFDPNNWRGQTTGTNRNYVLVRHDTFVEKHDRTFAGVRTQTYARYMHGAKGGVRDAFDRLGIAPVNIIGTRVTQGQTVMLAGNTGKSTHNHLHLQVMPEPPPAPPVPEGAPPPPPSLREADGGMTEVTLPFVFADVDEDNGVPRRLTWYRSGNTPPAEAPT